MRLRARLRELRRADRTLILTNSFADLTATYVTRTRRLKLAGLATEQFDELLTAWRAGQAELVATYRTSTSGRSEFHEAVTRLDADALELDDTDGTWTARLVVPEEPYREGGLSPRQWSQLELHMWWGAARMVYVFDAKITRKMCAPPAEVDDQLPV